MTVQGIMKRARALLFPEKSAADAAAAKLRSNISRSGPQNPRLALRGLTSEEMMWLFVNADQLDERSKAALPGMPSEHMQKSWTGVAGMETMAEARNFFDIIDDFMRRFSNPLAGDSGVLDFGCGWGRILRYFMRDVDPANLYGIDCFPEAVEAAKTHARWINFEQNEPMPPSRFGADSFDLVYLFSVFSHLSEEAHLAWLEEFHRILKPGGLVVATTRPRSFILHCADLRKQEEVPWYATGTANSFLDTDSFLELYDSGGFCHSGTGAGGPLDSSFYGETCIPPGYVDRVWSKWFEPMEFRNGDEKLYQNTICCRKPRA